mgnify:CR=1 FL=1
MGPAAGLGFCMTCPERKLNRITLLLSVRQLAWSNRLLGSVLCVGGGATGVEGVARGGTP